MKSEFSDQLHDDVRLYFEAQELLDQSRRNGEIGGLILGQYMVGMVEKRLRKAVGCD